MARGRTESSMRLQARRNKAYELFLKGFDDQRVAREIQVTPATAARYREKYEAKLAEQARSNPAMLKNILQNTIASLAELDKVREAAWSEHEEASSPQTRAQCLNTILKAQEQRSKLFGLFGVKADYFAHVQAVRAQQEKLIEFLQSNLCPADRMKLEEFIVTEFASELDQMPTAVGSDIDL